MNFTNEKDLLAYAKRLEGLKISQVSKLVGRLDTIERQHTKGIVSQVIETGYFGIATNSSENPDFEQLGIELKVSPLRFVSRANLYTTKERNVIKMVDYFDVHNHPDWRQSSLCKKLSKTLFVIYIHDNSIPATEWKIASVFLWSPTPSQHQLIDRDYKIMREKILAGQRNREGDHTFLATCPKHPGGFIKSNPPSSNPLSIREHPTMKIAEKRGFCIKREAFIVLIAEAIGAPLVRKGATIGIAPEDFTKIH